MKSLYNKIMNRSVQKDVCIVLEEFLNNAILNDNDDIWVDLYKPFGNSNKYGDIIEILELKLDEEENEIMLSEHDEKLLYLYAKEIYFYIPIYIKDICIRAIKKYKYKPYGEEFDIEVKKNINEMVKNLDPIVDPSEGC